MTKPMGTPATLPTTYNKITKSDTNTRAEQLSVLLSSRILCQRRTSKIGKLPYESLTKIDIIHLYHSMIHDSRRSYFIFLKGFPELRFLMLNEVPTIATE